MKDYPRRTFPVVIDTDHIVYGSLSDMVPWLFFYIRKTTFRESEISLNKEAFIPALHLVII